MNRATVKRLIESNANQLGADAVQSLKQQADTACEAQLEEMYRSIQRRCGGAAKGYQGKVQNIPHTM